MVHTVSEIEYTTGLRLMTKAFWTSVLMTKALSSPSLITNALSRSLLITNALMTKALSTKLLMTKAVAGSSVPRSGRLPVDDKRVGDLGAEVLVDAGDVLNLAIAWVGVESDGANQAVDSQGNSQYPDGDS